MGFFSKTRRLNLALQGGGAHGAFTWGVLDRLLEAEHIEFGWISGTSAGALNAVAVAHGLVKGGRSEARAALKRLWEGVEAAGTSDLVKLNPFLYGMSKSAGLSQMGSMLSPYDFNPLGFDPLRKLLEACIDFPALRAKPGIDLLIAATDIATGRARIFRRKELTVEAVLASACLPQIHHAVEIEGRAYWDGGFSANPDLITLANESPIGDTLLVQLNPLQRLVLPKTARDIAGQVNTITFNQPLLRDVEVILAAQEEIGPGGWFRRGNGTLARLGRHRFHVVEAGRHTSSLGSETKASPEKKLLAQLFTAGRSEMSRWLERHGADIGKRQSVDLRQRYLAPAREPLPVAGDDDEPDATATAGSRI